MNLHTTGAASVLGKSENISYMIENEDCVLKYEMYRCIVDEYLNSKYQGDIQFPYLIASRASNRGSDETR